MSGPETPPRARWSFQPVDDSRVHELVADQIGFAIRSGGIAVGERLPSVEDMAREMRVSKPTVGEAIRMLARHGVVESRRGALGGVVVLTDEVPTSLVPHTTPAFESSLDELLEARRGLALELARLAVRRAGDDDLVALEKAAARLETAAAERRAERHDVDDFHYALARAARNELLAYYHHQVLQAFALRHAPARRVARCAGRFVDLYRRTVAAIRARAEPRVERLIEEQLALDAQVARGDRPSRSPPSAR